MQSAIQADQQQRMMQQQQQMLQQQRQYERLLQLQRQQNAFRQQQYAPPPDMGSMPPQAPQGDTQGNRGPYLVIDGHTLGDTLTPQSLPPEFTCHPSEQFADAQWCRNRKVTNEVWTSTAIILSSGNTIAYYSKFFEDATFQPGAVAGEIDRLSALHHQQARVLHMPGASRDLGGVIATWGSLALTQLDPTAANTLATGGNVTAGVLVDFLNNARESAKRGLPIFRIAGGPGYYWVARYDRNGKGSLRFGVANAQAYDIPIKPAAPPPALVAMAAPAPAPTPPIATAAPDTTPVASPPTASSTIVVTPPSASAAAQATTVATAAAPDAATPSVPTQAQPADTPEPVSRILPVVPDQGRRVALVIGNAAYKAVPTLTNPKSDAEAVAAGLKSAGFDVTVAMDLGLYDMTKAFREFRDKADSADWAMIYYAGHGIQVDGKDYLIPVDAVLQSSRDVDDEAIPLSRVLERLDRVKKLSIVVLDACRENPFEAGMSRGMGYRSVSRGLAREEPPHRHQVVFYSAGESKLAEDGSSDGHSPFAKAFLARLDTPGLEVNRMFNFVIEDVMAATNDSQVPTMSGSIGTDVYYFRNPVAAQR